MKFTVKYLNHSRKGGWRNERTQKRLYRRNLEEFFFELQLRDNTRLKQSVWEKAGEDTLRGLFLMKLRAKYERARTDEERSRIEQAARWGLAALDNREEVVRHEDQ